MVWPLIAIVMLKQVKKLQASPLDYIPALIANNNVNRDCLIENYFHLRLNYNEIMGFLFLYHGIRICLRHLKRVLASRGLRRRSGFTPVREVVDAVAEELQKSGSSLGYRLMHQKQKNYHGLVVDRHTVRKIIKGLDPEGVDYRSKRKLKRRKYFANANSKH